MPILIGITMRVTQNQAYPDPRDALAHDWCEFIFRIFPDAVLLPILNCKEMASNLMETVKLNGVIFSNGNDVGECFERDSAERFVFDFCLEKSIPIFGVCRGLQVLNMFFGGQIEKTITKVSGEFHAGTDHDVELIAEPFIRAADKTCVHVNSFHNHGVKKQDLAPELQAFAVTRHLVEGFYHRTLPVIAVQWHPERTGLHDPIAVPLIQALFAGSYADFIKGIKIK